MNLDIEGFFKLKLMRYGNCIHCGDCCRIAEFDIPDLWRNGRCVYLSDNVCTVWDTDRLPQVCRDFPIGKERYIIRKWLEGRALDFKPLLPNCPFWFSVEANTT